MANRDLADVPLPELADELKSVADKMLEKNDFVRGMVFNVLANRFTEAVEEIDALEERVNNLEWQVNPERMGR
jgi:BMFP domain-containing protein YqiC